MDSEAPSPPLLPCSLEAALIPTIPPSAYYIPNFITRSEEAHLLEKICNVPLPTWRSLSHRRLQVHPSPLSSTNTLLASPLPTWLSDPIIPRLLSLPLTPSNNMNVFANSPHHAPNHVLINEYRPGQGILPHEDGPAYYPVVATVSLGACTILNICSKQEAGPKWRILQERRSLLVTTGEIYEECLHGIKGVEVDENLREAKDGVCNWGLLGDPEEYRDGRMERETRISLTFRDVIKVKKLGKALDFLGK